MRDLLIVVDHKQDKHDRWIPFQTTTIRVPDGTPNAEAAAVREHCTRLGVTYKANGYPDRLRVRSWSDITMREALTADLDAIPPTAEYIYPPA